MNELQFLSLDSVHISWGIVLFSVWWWRTLHNRYFSVQKWLSPSLDTLLVRTPLRLQMVYFGMVTAGLFCGVVAMMRPVSFGVERVSETSVEADVVIALDVSKSMWAEDAAPNRLDRAKYEIMEMVDAMPGYRFGLVGFAGSASVLCPLTTDVGFFQLALNNASPSSISRGGTNLGTAIRKSVRTFAGGTAPKLLVLITDGEDHDSEPLVASESARDLGIPIVTIGFGSEQGSEITLTDPQTGARTQLVDRDGQTIVSRLDGSLLRDIALLTDGAFVPAGVSSLDLEGIVVEHITPIVQSSSIRQTTTVQPKHSGWIGVGVFLLGMAVLVRAKGGER